MLMLTKRKKNEYKVAYTVVSQFYKIVCLEGDTKVLIMAVSKK